MICAVWYDEFLAQHVYFLTCVSRLTQRVLTRVSNNSVCSARTSVLEKVARLEVPYCGLSSELKHATTYRVSPASFLVKLRSEEPRL
ncbi:hypothetical protein RRG08_020432 [Elysia crispata]|uniref:Uncharacterized protein n=1 Tax=Elysia crispata TaxID=231223 RepID=A0AAE1EAB7_9GAST|nr:hypothetical protein RRG08_020432 [Elysia crispata]